MRTTKLRDELLEREIFDTFWEAKVLIERWRREYNRHRPHSALGDRTPIEFARNSAGHAPLNSLVR